MPTSKTQDAGPILAKVNGEALTQKEFEFFLPEDHENLLSSEERMEYLNRWITTQLLYGAVVDAGGGDSEEIEARLRQYRKDLIADQLVQQVIEERAVVTDSEVRAFYEAHIHEYVKEFRVSHILVNTREDAEKVQGLLGSKSFEYLSRRYSIDKHSRYGGDLGYLSKGSMIPEFEDVVFDMNVGDVSDIIESDFGYHIVKMADIREARFKLAFEDVRDEIANILTLEKRTAVYDSLITQLRERADIEVMDDALRWAREDADTLERNP